MNIYIWDKEIKDLCIWDSSAKEVYVWDTKVRPSTSLKSYEEIVAMATDEWYERPNTIAELNQYADDYYNKFNQEWHLYGDIAWWYAIQWISESVIIRPKPPIRHIYWIDYLNGTRWIVMLA